LLALFPRKIFLPFYFPYLCFLRRWVFLAPSPGKIVALFSLDVALPSLELSNLGGGPAFPILPGRCSEVAFVSSVKAASPSFPLSPILPLLARCRALSCFFRDEGPAPRSFFRNGLFLERTIPVLVRSFLVFPCLARAHG